MPCLYWRRQYSSSEYKFIVLFSFWLTKFTNPCSIVLLLRLVVVSRSFANFLKDRWYLYENRNNTREKAISREIKLSPKTYTKVTRTELDNFVPKFYREDYESRNFGVPAEEFCPRVSFATLKESHKEIFDSDFCIICLEKFCDEEQLIILPCDHYLHYTCLSSMRETQIRQMRDQLVNEAIILRCPLCQLNLVRHYIFYKEKMLDPKKVKFHNKE